MFLFILGSVKTDATEMLSCLFFIYCFLSGTLSQNVLSSKESPEGSCGRLCSCTEKDNMLYVNCEEKNIDSIAKIKLPPARPFHLNLYKNDLVELLPEGLIGLKNAHSLNLGGNSIQQLEPGVFHALSFLKKLYINKNFLVALKEDTFLGLVNLEYLQADTNFIEVIEHGTFNRLIHLKVLILNDNSIRVLPRNIFRFVPLTHLDLRGNQLQSLPYVGFLEHIGRIVELLLEDNKWLCDCEMLLLKIWRDTMVTQSSVSEVVCDSPANLKDHSLSNIMKDDLCPTYGDTSLEESSKSLNMVATPSSKILKLVIASDDAIFTTPTPVLTSDVACVELCSCLISSTAGFLIHCEDKGLLQKLNLNGNRIDQLFSVVFSASGIVFLIVHRKQRSKKKHREDRPQDGGPVDVKHGMSAQKNCCPLTERKTENIKQDPTYSPAATDWYNHDCHTHSKYQGKEDRSQNHQEEIELLSRSLVYAAPRGVVLDWTKNEHFELKGNSQTDPEYLEIINHHNHHLQ
nr:SLIT and NTRK-like protein 6 isoform X4 [Paramormyrops kingsleyae]